VITINVPPQPAPVVHVDAPVVHVAAPPAPYVVVDVAAPPAPSVTINSPRIAEENQTIERDARGNITSTTTTVTYEGGNQ